MRENKPGGDGWHPLSSLIENWAHELLATYLDIGTTKAWIEARLGIVTRRTVLPLDYIRTTRNADVREAAEAAVISGAEASEIAARSAMTRAGITASELDLIISGSSNASHLAPPEAFVLADRLGIAPFCADINSACNTFLTQAQLVTPLLHSTSKRFALLVQSELLTRALDYRERTNACLMGDGATAVIVSTVEPSACFLEGARIESMPSLWRTAVITAQGYFQQNGPDVRRFATEQLAHGVTKGSSDFVVFHQTSLRILEAVADGLGLAPQQHLYNVDQFGNCGSAGAVSVLSQNWEQLMETRRGVQLSVVGAGLSFGSARLGWI